MHVEASDLAYECAGCGETLSVIFEEGRMVCTKDGERPIQVGDKVYHASCVPFPEAA